jgi:hypothetical protein
MPVVSISKHFRHPVRTMTVAEAESIASPFPATVLDARLDAEMAWIARNQRAASAHASCICATFKSTICRW